MRKYLKEIFSRIDLLLYLISSGLKSQHRNNFLGYFWWLLDPLLGIVNYFFVVVIVFGKGGPDYGPYLVVGMVVWRWFSTSIITSSKSIFTKSSIIQQVYLPKAIFPLATTMSQLVNFMFGLIVIAIFFVFFGILPSIHLLWLPVIILLMYIMILFIALVVAYCSTYVRDIDMLVKHILQLWFYASPVIWETNLFPSKYDWIIKANPMYHFLEAFRGIAFLRDSPSPSKLMLIGVISLVGIIIMLCLYEKNEHKMVKNL